MVRRTPKRRTGVVAACSAGAGMLVTYLLDPDRGRARRSRLGQQTQAAIRRTRRDAGRRTRYGTGSALGAARRAIGRGRFHPVDDIDVVHAIKQEFARLPFATSDVNIDVVDGVATLRGQLADDDQIREVCDAAMKVRGVQALESYLHRPGEPAPNKAASLSAVS